MNTIFLTCTLIGGVLSAPAFAADEPAELNPFEIKSIQKVVKAVVAVDNGWKENAPCIQAELRVTSEPGSPKLFAKAYFFDKNYTRVLSYGAPPQVSDDHKTYTGMPPIFKPRQVNKVWFPIGEKATQTGAKWTRVVIVFGDAKRAVAESFPKDDLTLFDFPEKQRALATARPAPRQ